MKPEFYLITLYPTGGCSQSIWSRFQFIKSRSVAIVDFESNKGIEPVRAMKIIKLITYRARYQSSCDMRFRHG